MSEFVIETGIPLPDRCPNKITSALRALHAAPSGSSVFFPGKTSDTITIKIRAVDSDKWATTRTTLDGVRVWRL